MCFEREERGGDILRYTRDDYDIVPTIEFGWKFRVSVERSLYL